MSFPGSHWELALMLHLTPADLTHAPAKRARAPGGHVLQSGALVRACEIGEKEKKEGFNRFCTSSAVK